MNKIYVVTQYIYDTQGKAVGSEPVVAYGSEDTALDFMDTFDLGDEVVEVEFAWPLYTKFTESAKVVYSGNVDAASTFLEGFLNGSIGKVPHS